MDVQTPKLRSSLTPGADIYEITPGVLRLQIPAGPSGKYRLAQLDDYGRRPRKDFFWHPGSQVRVQMRASSAQIPGTWGVGFWNNPFGLAILTGVEMLRLPVLPETTWYFFASPQNYLSFRDDLPANGALAATFTSLPRSNLRLAMAAPLFPLFAVPPLARILRKWIATLIQEDSQSLAIDPTLWHDYFLDWQGDQVIFEIDERRIFVPNVTPNPPLGFVLWIDNQYAAFPASGRLRFGSLENAEPAWIEIRALTINGQTPIWQ